MSRQRHSRSILGPVLILCLGSLGCGPSGVRAPASDIEAARALLSRSLEQWQVGQSVEQLRAADPPVYFADDAFVKGVHLKQFQLVTTGEMYVTNVKFEVKLQLEGAAGQEARESTVVYLVTTTPALTISRLE